MSWADDAACAHLDQSLFYDRNGGDTAVAVCATCPVRAVCLWEAVEFERDEPVPPAGVRGGLSATERADLIDRVPAGRSLAHLDAAVAMWADTPRHHPQHHPSAPRPRTPPTAHPRR